MPSSHKHAGVHTHADMRTVNTHAQKHTLVPVRLEQEEYELKRNTEVKDKNKP